MALHEAPPVEVQAPCGHTRANRDIPRRADRHPPLLAFRAVLPFARRGAAAGEQHRKAARAYHGDEIAEGLN